MADHSIPAHVQQEQLPFSRPASRGTGAHPPLTVGFVGLGAMGYLMARNLAVALASHNSSSVQASTHSHDAPHHSGNPPLVVYNRTAEKCKRLASEVGSEKVRVVGSAGEVVRECDVILTSLGSDEAVKTVYGEFSKVLEGSKHDKPKIFVETSTIYPTLAGELDNLISGFPHTHLVTCPVFGPPAAADKAQLILTMAGDYHSKKEVAYLLVPAVGRKVIDLGGNIEKAPTMKLIGNSLILGAIEIMSETMTLGEKAGIDSETVLSLIKDLFPATPMANYGQRVVNDEFDGTKGFAIDGGIKDASHIRRLTSEFNAPMPVIDIAHANMLTARALHANQVARGKERFPVLDWSALIAGPRVAAGLDGLDSKKHLMKVMRED